MKRSRLDAWVDEHKTDLLELSSLPQVATAAQRLNAADPAGDPTARQVAHDELVHLMRLWTGEGGQFQELMLIAADSGQVVVSTNPQEEGKFKEDRPFFIHGRKEVYVQNVYYSIGIQGIAMTVSAPLKAPGGALLGVLAGRLNLEEMNGIINRRTSLFETLDSYLVNTSKVFVTQPLYVSDPAVLRRTLRTEPVRRCLLRDSGSLKADDYRGVPVIAVYHWLPARSLCLIVAVDQAEAIAATRNLGRNIALLSGVILLGAAGLAVGLSRSYTRPILRLQQDVARFGRGETGVRLPVRHTEKRHDELDLLAGEFNRMADALAEKEARLRAYSAELETTVEERTRDMQIAQMRMRWLQEAGMLGIVVADKQGNIFEANDYYLNILGLTCEEMDRGEVRWIDLTPEEHLPADYRTLDELEQSGVCRPYEKEYFRRDGSRAWVLIIDAMLPDEGDRILSLVLDITERKRAEAELATYLQELQRSNADLQQFAYVASHDLQEPLRAVAGMVQLLRQRYQGQIDETADTYITHAVEGATRMQSLINDLLAYSRVGTHGRTFEPVDSAEAVNEAISNLALAIRESGAVVTCGSLPVVRADAIQLMQLFQNLVANAIKFRSQEPPQIQVEAERDGNQWIFSVRDNGIGIEPQYSDRIFGVFQRLHTRREYPGTGIGLAICKKIVERHGGRIWVDSLPGQGSTFRFTLPANHN